MEIEEAARAGLYGLLATLLYAPPAQALLNDIAAATADEEGGVLHADWLALSAACATADEETVRDEYETLFIGVGKPEVILYGSYHLSGFLMEKPLAALRDDLQQLGLQRDDSVTESEDHIAALCDVMRYLITAEDQGDDTIAIQKQFFSRHIQPWAGIMCETLLAHPKTRFYAPVAQLARSFFAVEQQAFDMC